MTSTRLGRLVAWALVAAAVMPATAISSVSAAGQLTGPYYRPGLNIDASASIPHPSDLAAAYKSGGMTGIVTPDGAFAGLNVLYCAGPATTICVTRGFIRNLRTGAVVAVPALAPGTTAYVMGMDDSARLASVQSCVNSIDGQTKLACFPFVMDVATGSMTRLPQPTLRNGTSAQVFALEMSGDGRYVLVQTALVDGVGGQYDDLLYDRTSGTYTWVAGLASFGAALSRDGNTVVYTITDTNAPGQAKPATAGGSGGTLQVYAWSRSTGKAEEISVNDAGQPGNSASVGSVEAVSANGQFVAFQSGATNLVPQDSATSLGDAYVRDRVAHRTQRVSLSYYGDEGNGEFNVLNSDPPVISGDGRWVGMRTDSTNWIPGMMDPGGPLGVGSATPHGHYQVYVADRISGTVEVVSTGADGAVGKGGGFFPRGVSGDGRYIAYYGPQRTVQADTTCDPFTDGDNCRATFVHDRGPTQGVGGVNFQSAGAKYSVNGWATFNPVVLAATTDVKWLGADADDTAGARLREGDMIYRPELGDITFMLKLTQMPTLNASVLCAVTCPPRQPQVAGDPRVLYGVQLSIDGVAYELRVVRLAATTTPPAAPYFGVFKCGEVSTLCVETARIHGSYGTAGSEVRVSLPLAAIGASAGSKLTGASIFTAIGDPSLGAVLPLSSAVLQKSGSITLGRPAVTVRLRAADGSQTGPATAETDSGRFSVNLDPSGLHGAATTAVVSTCLQTCVEQILPSSAPLPPPPPPCTALAAGVCPPVLPPAPKPPARTWKGWGGVHHSIAF